MMDSFWIQDQEYSSPTGLWQRVIFFMLAWIGAAWLSQAVSLQGGSFDTLWFPSGVFLTVLLFCDLRDWSAYLLAVIPVSLGYHLWYGQSAAVSALFTLSMILEACAGALLVRRFAPQSVALRTPGQVFSFLLWGGVFSTILSATLNTTLLAMLQRGLDYQAAWRISFIGHSLGILAVAPMMLSWADFHWGGWRKSFTHPANLERLIELLILMTGLVVGSLYIFLGSFEPQQRSYIIVPFLVWLALRFGMRGVTFGGVLITLVSAWGMAQQLGGFAVNNSTIAPNLDGLASFLSITFVTCYFLATAWSQGKLTENQLRASEARYRMLVENQAEGVAIVDTREVFTFANPAAKQIFGVTELVGHSLKEFMDPVQFAKVCEQTLTRQTGQKSSYALDIEQPSGKRRSLLISAVPELDAQGQYRGAFSVFHDDTERKQVEMALRDSRARFQALFDHSPVPIWEEDFSRVKRLIDALRREGVEDFRGYFQQHPEQVDACLRLVRFLDINQATLRQFQSEDKSTFLSQVNHMVDRGPNDVFIEELVAIAAGKSEFQMEGPNDLVDGVIHYHFVRWTVAPGYHQNYRRVIVTILDVTERVHAEERMRYLSTHDVLTGLYNRNFFEAEIDRLQGSRLSPINVMMVDVNGMKTTNDTYGHAAGDDLLRRSAQVLHAAFRKEDIIARIGGDEFVVLFHGSVSIDEAIQRVQACLVEHNAWYDGPPLSLAIGAASGSKSTALLDLLKRADQQMYKEKMRQRKARISLAAKIS